MRVFLQGSELVDPWGIAVGAGGSVYIAMAGQSPDLVALPKVIKKFTPTGRPIWTTPTPDGMGCLLDRDRQTGVIWAQCGPWLLTVDPQTGKTAQIANLTRLQYDQGKIFDAAQVQGKLPVSNVVPLDIGNARFGDMALHRTGGELYVFVTARHSLSDYILRLRFSALSPPKLAEARVLIGSGAKDAVLAPEPGAPAKGIAVAANGTVAAPVPAYNPKHLHLLRHLFGPSMLMSFPVTFDPARPGAAPTYTKHSALGKGMTSDDAGNFYLAAHGTAYLATCPGGPASGVIRYTPNLQSATCIPMGDPFLGPHDVAVDSARGVGYVTARNLLTQESYVYSFALPAPGPAR